MKKRKKVRNKVASLVHRDFWNFIGLKDTPHPSAEPLPSNAGNRDENYEGLYRWLERNQNGGVSNPLRSSVPAFQYLYELKV